MEEKKSKGVSIFTAALSSLVFVLIVRAIWPNAIPFGMFQFWSLEGSILDIIELSWPLFAWGAGISLINLIRTHNNPEINKNAELLLGVGFLKSIKAGVMEEIFFRWLFFFEQIAIYQFVNFLFFGWLGFGLPEWIYLHISGPVVNFLTLGYLSNILYSTSLGWFVGAAMISSNGKFRDGHIYLGWLGWVNAWFAGMYMFFLMFKFGILAAIVVHFIYDMLLFTLAYLDAANERRLGYVE